MKREPLTARQMAKRLNDHHTRTSAGFYGSVIGDRFFMARARKDVLQVSPDFGRSWRDVVGADIAFHDYNGRSIAL